MEKVVQYDAIRPMGEIIKEVIKLLYGHIRVDGVTAAEILGVSYSTFRRWRDSKLIKGSGEPEKYSFSDLLMCDKAEMQRKYRMLNK